MFLPLKISFSPSQFSFFLYNPTFSFPEKNVFCWQFLSLRQWSTQRRQSRRPSSIWLRGSTSKGSSGQQSLRYEWTLYRRRHSSRLGEHLWASFYLHGRMRHFSSIILTFPHLYISTFPGQTKSSSQNSAPGISAFITDAFGWSSLSALAYRLGSAMLSSTSPFLDNAQRVETLYCNRYDVAGDKPRALDVYPRVFCYLPTSVQ